MSTLEAVRSAQARSAIWRPFTFRPLAVSFGPEDVGDGAGAGAMAVTVTDTCCEADSPPLSVTVAVITCDPTESVLEKPLPVPSDPSLLDDHAILLVRDPS